MKYEEDRIFISHLLHSIRDHITMTMGATIGTEEAMQIAEIETKVAHLADCILYFIDCIIILWEFPTFL